MKLNKFYVGIMAACFTLTSAPSFAANFSINPTKAELTQRKNVETLTLISSDSTPSSFELSLLKWTQKTNGEWIEEPSTDLVVYPALLKIDPNGKGIVRIGLKDKGLLNSDTEGSYRLIIQELAGDTSSSGSTVKMLTKVSLPVFISPITRNNDVELSVSGLGKSLEFTLNNTGNLHIPPQNFEIKYLDESGNQVGDLIKSESNTNYLLPGTIIKLNQSWPSNCSSIRSVNVILNDKRELNSPIYGSSCTK